LLIPLLLNFYQPAWNSFLKSVPLFKSSSTNIRWFCAYIPVVILVSVLCFEKIELPKPYKWSLTYIFLFVIIISNLIKDRSYYHNQTYNPKLLLYGYNYLREGKLKPEIKFISKGVYVDEKNSVRGNDLFVAQTSQLEPYEPMFGYYLEKFPKGDLTEGSVSELKSNGHYNMKNPVSYVFPVENSCKPGDHFLKGQENQLESFRKYKPFPFKMPVMQASFNRISVFTIFILFLSLLIIVSRRVYSRLLFYYKTLKTSGISLKERIEIVNPVIIACCIFILSVLLFARTINYGFAWDDERIHLTVNKDLMEGKISPFWEKAYSGMYIPVSYTTWSLVKSFFYPHSDISPSAFHALNVLFHALNCVLIFLLLNLFFRNKYVSLCGTLIFMFHPLQVEAVAWISEFRGVYSTFFGLSALLLFFQKAQSINSVSWRSFVLSKHFLAATLLFILSLLCKPSSVVLPFIAALLVFGFFKEKMNYLLGSLSVWVLMLIPVIIITNRLQPAIHINDHLGIADKATIASYSIVFYLRKILFPYPLAACYGETPPVILHDKFIWLYAPAVIAGLVFLFIKRKQYPVLFLSVLIIITGLLPVLGFTAFKFQAYSNVADRYTYLSFFGVSLLAAHLAGKLLELKNYRLVFGSVMTCYLVITFFQTATWKSEFEVWNHNLKHYQNAPSVYYNRGVEYSKKERFREAISDFNRCLALDPKYKDALFNRINAYENLNDIEAALDDCSAYLKIDSTDGSIYYRKAKLLYKAGRQTEAEWNMKLAQHYNFRIEKSSSPI